MRLNVNDVHIWSTVLTLSHEEENQCWNSLNHDEHEQAKRFRLPLHRQRFIAARGFLRQLLNLYLALPPKDIRLAYGKYRKPYVDTLMRLQFNLSHSEDRAVYAFALEDAVGIDIEKIKNTYPPGIAKRFFSAEENQALLQLPEEERAAGFYRLWSRKEAIVKAIGKGLSQSLSDFSVSIHHDNERIIVAEKTCSLSTLLIHPDYAAALASLAPTPTISYWQLINHQPVLKAPNGYILFPH